MNFSCTNPYKVQLPTPLHLQSYEVAVKFLHLPSSFYNIPASSVEIRLDDTKQRINIPAGYYTTVQDLIGTIAHKIGTGRGISLAYSPGQRSVSVTLSEPRMSIRFSAVLSTILCLPTGTIKNHVESNTPVLFNGSAHVFYVTNFTVPQYYNDRMSGILAAVTVGPNQVWTNQENSYVRVKPGLFCSRPPQTKVKK